jgi:hypothetical protein
MWTSDFVKQAAMAVARHALTGLAGVLVSDGLITSNQTNDLIGSGLFIAGIAWSWWQKHNQQTALAVAKQGAK